MAPNSARAWEAHCPRRHSVLNSYFCARLIGDMMTDTLREIEKGHEAKFKLDEELRFKVQSRRNKLFGLWAAEQLGLRGGQSDEYARSLIRLGLEKPGHDDVVAKVLRRPRRRRHRRERTRGLCGFRRLPGNRSGADRRRLSDAARQRPRAGRRLSPRFLARFAFVSSPLSGSEDPSGGGILLGMRTVRAHPARQLLLFAFIAALALPLACCGRKGAPEPPPGADYPRSYPSR